MMNNTFNETTINIFGTLELQTEVKDGTVVIHLFANGFTLTKLVTIDRNSWIEVNEDKINSAVGLIAGEIKRLHPNITFEDLVNKIKRDDVSFGEVVEYGEFKFFVTLSKQKYIALYTGFGGSFTETIGIDRDLNVTVNEFVAASALEKLIRDMMRGNKKAA